MKSDPTTTRETGIAAATTRPELVGACDDCNKPDVLDRLLPIRGSRVCETCWDRRYDMGLTR